MLLLVVLLVVMFCFGLFILLRMVSFFLGRGGGGGWGLPIFRPKLEVVTSLASKCSLEKTKFAFLGLLFQEAISIMDCLSQKRYKIGVQAILDAFKLAKSGENVELKSCKCPFLEVAT